MAHHQRTASNVEAAKEPHAVSLKVLRLSRPSLAVQHPLPLPTPGLPANLRDASLACPRPDADAGADESFILAPLLTLPPAFGSAYVGETFACTLCANNEVREGGKRISGVRVEAEMKIPSALGAVSLEFVGAKQEDEEEGAGVPPGGVVQRIVSFDLKEEGSHVLAVTVTYTEDGERVRTFRKLYQFVCKSCMVVRTKTAVLEGASGRGGRKWALEAQLENVGDESLLLSRVVLEPVKGVRSEGEIGQGVERPLLGPGDVQQVCFVVEEVLDESGQGAEAVDGRVVFGVLSLGWRGPMGNIGVLSTGTLGARIQSS